MIRNHVRRILDSGPEEYEVIEQADGHQALNWLSQLHQQEFPDLILLDRNMPKMSGDECIRILKKEEDSRVVSNGAGRDESVGERTCRT